MCHKVGSSGNTCCVAEVIQFGAHPECDGPRLVASEAPSLITRRASRHAALLPPGLDRIAASHAVRPSSAVLKGSATRLIGALAGYSGGRPRAPARHRGMPHSSSCIGIRGGWLPGWHDVGDRLCRLRSRRPGRPGRTRRLLRWETTVPDCRTNIPSLPLRPASHNAPDRICTTSTTCFPARRRVGEWSSFRAGQPSPAYRP